jgi:hypothetical protein
LVLAIFSLFCVYWPDQASGLFSPLISALLDLAKAAGLQLIGLWQATWVFLAEYVLEPFLKVSFEIFIPIFISFLLCACLLNRTGTEDEAFGKYAKALKRIGNTWVGYMILLVLSLVPHINESDANPGLIAIVSISFLMLMVMFYTDYKNKNIFAWGSNNER